MGGTSSSPDTCSFLLSHPTPNGPPYSESEEVDFDQGLIRPYAFSTGRLVRPLQGKSDNIQSCPFTAGLLISDTHTKNQPANAPEGLRHFRDHRWKFLGEENPDVSGLFLFGQYFESYIE